MMNKSMAAANIFFFHSPPRFLATKPPPPPPLSSSSSSFTRSRRVGISCSAPSPPPNMEDISGPQKELMVDLVSTLESRLDSMLNPCDLPPDVRCYSNQANTAHASLLARSGLPNSQIDFILGSWLHCKLPSGGALKITSLSAYLNASTDAPNFLFELIQSSPTSVVLILDLPPRKELALNPDYLKTFYEDTQLDKQRQLLEKLPEVRPYFSSSLYIRSVVSPTAILVLIRTKDNETEVMEDIIRQHVKPIAKEMLGTWLDVCACATRGVGETERMYLEKRDQMTKSKTIEIDLVSNMPRLFGQEVADRVLEALRGFF